MLSADSLKKYSQQRRVDIEQLAKSLVKPGRNQKQAVASIKNWQNNNFKQKPTADDIRRLANALSVDAADISDWSCCYKYAPISARKARLITELINGRNVQEAMDILKYTSKRAAGMVDKVLKSAVANADEQQADVDSLFVSCARVDDAGVRIGTKRFRPKDRGRAHSIQKKACHIHISVTQE